MTLREIVSIMNILEVTCFGGNKMHKLNMRDWEHDPCVIEHGDATVRQITNIARQGVTIWLEERDEAYDGYESEVRRTYRVLPPDLAVTQNAIDIQGWHNANYIPTDVADRLMKLNRNIYDGYRA